MSSDSPPETGSFPFCSTEFWNLNLTWNTETPHFSQCFYSTVLVYVPCAVLWILSPLDFYFYKVSGKRDVPWRWKIILRLIFTLLLFLITILELALTVHNLNSIDANVSVSDILSPVVKCLTFAFSAVLIFFGRKFGQVTSGPQFLFWLAYSIAQGFTLASFIIGRAADSEAIASSAQIYHILFSTSLGFSVAITFLNVFSDDAPEYTDLSEHSDNPVPENSASFASKIVFGWFDSLILQGWKKPLTQPDLWDLGKENSYKEIVPHWESFLFKNSDDSKISILWPLIRCFGFYYLTGGICQAFYIMFQFVNPQVLDLLIRFVEERQEMWKGYLYVVLLGCTAFMVAVFDSWYWNQMRLLGLRIMTALAASIYKKSLRLSSSARKDYTSGDVVNLIAVDCSKIEEAVMFLNLMWATPMQVGLAIYFLWQVIGVSVFVGFGILAVFIPINIVVWAIMEKYQQEQMRQKDVRVNLVNEVLNGIKVLKLMAWEKSFIDRIGQIRNSEVSALRIFQYLEGTQFLMWNCAPFMVALGSFATYVLIDPVNNVLDAKTAFVSLTLFNTLKEPLFLLPFGIVNIIQGVVSAKRINKYLNAEELDPDSVTHDKMSHPVVIRNASFSWGSKNNAPILRNLDFTVKEGALIAVVGKVGAGKSSLLSALLGEMTRIKGVANITGSIGYVAQQAWMRNMTLKENILFGKSYNHQLYQKVLSACALVDDLAMLPGGDATEIGEKGINLSGGQKQRINMARAVYNNRNMYFLDDPLSAVDSHVGKHLFDEVIGPNGMLKRKTRILVTHGIAYLPYADQIIVLKNGEIVEYGSYDELMNKKADFADFILEQLQQAEEDSDSETDTEHIWKQLENTLGKDELRKRQTSVSSRRHRTRTTSVGALSDSDSYLSNPDVHEFSLSRFNSMEESVHAKKSYDKSTKKDLIEEEYAEVTGVKYKIYSYYGSAVGLVLSLLSFICYTLFQVFTVSANLLLSLWSDDPNATTDTSVRNNYLIAYGVLGGLQSLFIFLAVIIITVGSIKASIKLHNDLLINILHSTMAFFDTTPTGRIVNRFSKDIDEVDIMLPMHIKDIFNQVLNCLGVIFILSYAFPTILVAIVPLVGFFLFVQTVYLQSSRQLKRLLSINRSPINSHLDETLSGTSTIRAYRFQQKFTEENEDKIEDLQMSKYPELISNSWLFSRLQFIGLFLSVSAGLIIVIGRDTIDTGLVGLSLTYVMSCQLDIYMLTRFTADLEKSIVSVERIKEYQETPQEAASELPDTDPPNTWPVYGNISFEDYSVRYRPGLDLVLSGVTCDIHSGEKIGIVGRTGAGKSSITLSLFRIIEAAAGRITIDDIDIAQIGLERLRSSLTIIPQDPVLFSGTLRFNLDPFGQYTDKELWRALQLSHLSDMANKLDGGMEHVIAEGGTNLSVGQRQLVCLVRALLRKSRILVLDEATAAVDLETDDLIQSTIREEFNDCTVLTIAHRLKTIMDSSRVMVMDKGTIKEFDTPAKLLKNKQSVFYSMAKDAGIV